MASPIVIHSKRAEGEKWITMARVTDPSDAAFAQGGISSIALAVYNLSSPTPATNLYTGSTPTVGGSIFNSLQTDYGWNADSTGYNFRPPDIAPTDLSATVKGGSLAKAEYTITTNNYGVRKVFNYVTIVSSGSAS